MSESAIKTGQEHKGSGSIATKNNMMLNTDMPVTHGILVENINDFLFALSKLFTDLSLWGTSQASIRTFLWMNNEKFYNMKDLDELKLVWTDLRFDIPYQYLPLHLKNQIFGISWFLWEIQHFRNQNWQYQQVKCLWAWPVWQILGFFLPLHSFLYLDYNFKIRGIRKNVLAWKNNWWKDRRGRCEGK